MKTFGAALVASVLSELALANKVRLRKASSETTLQLKADLEVSPEASPCPHGEPNRYPDTLPQNFTIIGKNKLDMIWETATLREALREDKEWGIGRPWVLQATFTNNGNSERVFGFQGGPHGGFLELSVPAGCIDCVVMAEGSVQSSSNHTEFQYRSDANFTSGEVTMSNICLAPKACKNFAGCPRPAFQKLAIESFGDSESACCENRMCKDEVTCLPDTQYEPKSDFDTHVGSTLAACCHSKECPVDICDGEHGWSKPSSSGILGSSREECCVQSECMDWNCSDMTIWRQKPVIVSEGGQNYTRKGWSDIECCEEHMCSEYPIPVELRTVWQLKPDAASTAGNNISTCCEPRFCKDAFTCPNNTEWTTRADSNGPRPGSTQEECCTQLFCNAYECSSPTTLQKKTEPEARPGSTDDECCEQKFCKDYKCSDDTKWVHLSEQVGPTNLDRRGSSDDECCDPIHCRAETCEPLTQWKFKGEDVMGSTVDQCCEPIHCGQYSCENETAWYRKVDTNTYKWQGSSDEECCLPIYCSQYSTSTPTQWLRKPFKHLQGSTDLECYDQLWCYDYCCVGVDWIKKPGATTRPGSTDAECCTLDHSLPEVHQEIAGEP